MVKELQPAQRIWEKQALAHNQTFTERVNQLRQEVGEFFQDVPIEDASKMEKDPKYYALEAVDIMIMCSSIVDHLGFDVNALIYEKLLQNFTKYPKSLITKLMDGGLSHKEAMATAKKNWDERKTPAPEPRRRGW